MDDELYKERVLVSFQASCEDMLKEFKSRHEYYNVIGAIEIVLFHLRLANESQVEESMRPPDNLYYCDDEHNCKTGLTLSSCELYGVGDKYYCYACAETKTNSASLLSTLEWDNNAVSCHDVKVKLSIAQAYHSGKLWGDVTSVINRAHHQGYTHVLINFPGGSHERECAFSVCSSLGFTPHRADNNGGQILQLFCQVNFGPEFMKDTFEYTYLLSE